MGSPFHPVNWTAGWLLILASFLVGCVLGLFFHREEFLGGYQSFPRRLLRLGHIALAALGMTNVLFALSPWPAPGSLMTSVASACFVAGGVAMPAVCFLSAWRRPFRHLFAFPVMALIVAVLLTCIGGMS